MVNTLFSKVLPDCGVSFSPCITILQPVEVADKSGVVRRSSEFKSFDIAGSLAPFKSSDFSIVALESVGALSKLTTTYMSSMHDMNVADKFENFSIPTGDVPNS